jgi:RNA polymerase sigma factor (sigma-70 family)
MKNPLANPEPLIRRVYSYVAYRVGDGPDAEDVTSDVFERALRYRDTYDPARGAPAAWLIGIARRAVDEWLLRPRLVPSETLPEPEASTDIESEAVRRLTLGAAVRRLPERDRELIALRYGADLTARQIAELLGTSTNATEVALHRALSRLRTDLDAARADGEEGAAAPLAEAV